MTDPALTRVREMAEADIPRILDIERKSFSVPWTEDLFRAQLKLGDIAINLVLLEDEVIVGYAAAWAAHDEVHLLSIALIPQKRGMGYADVLLDSVIDRGRSKGGTRIVLEVRVGNAAARTFYERRGFEIIHTRRRYYRDSGEDAIVMELKLEQS